MKELFRNKDQKIEPEPMDEIKENNLREQLLTRLLNASSLEDLAEIKKDSLELDLSTGYFTEVHKAIIKRFEELLTNRVREIL